MIRVPQTGALKTSSKIEEGWAKDRFFTFSSDGSSRELRDTAAGGGGNVWGSFVRYSQGPGPTQYFYIGSESLYQHAVSGNRDPVAFDEKAHSPKSR